MLFAAGSTCFLVAPIPAFLQLVGPVADGVVFFVGSLLFTSAAALQWRQTIHAGRSDRIDRWSSGVQLLGTLFFNATTFRALQTGLDSPSYDRLRRPDFGSICFLISGYLAYVEINGLRWAAAPDAELGHRQREPARLPGLRGVRGDRLRRPLHRQRDQPGHGEHVHLPGGAVLPRRRAPAAPPGRPGRSTQGQVRAEQDRSAGPSRSAAVLA